MCMGKAPSPPPPKAPPVPPSQLDAKVDSTRNRQARAAGVGMSAAMTGAGLAPEAQAKSPVLGV
jgi:hypothetical protein